MIRYNPQDSMRNYELMMILSPSLTEDERTSLVTTIESELADAGAKILTTDHPGQRALAYHIHGPKEGYYLLYTLEKSGDFVSTNNSFNIKKDIWRYMFTKIEA
jgi:small subunit ribosomal protein S6